MISVELSLNCLLTWETCATCFACQGGYIQLNCWAALILHLSKLGPLLIIDCNRCFVCDICIDLGCLTCTFCWLGLPFKLLHYLWGAPVVLVGVFWLDLVILSDWLSNWQPRTCDWIVIVKYLNSQCWNCWFWVKALTGQLELFVEILGGQSFAFAGWIEYDVSELGRVLPPHWFPPPSPPTSWPLKEGSFVVLFTLIALIPPLRTM